MSALCVWFYVNFNFTPKQACFLLSRTYYFYVKQFTHSFLHFSSFSPRPTIWNCWVVRTGTRRYKNHSEQRQEPTTSQRSCSVTSGGIRTRGLLIGAAPHNSFQQRFPIEKKKNFSITCDLFYLLLSPYFLFSTCSPCKQTNQNLRICLIFFCPLSCAVHNSAWDGSAHQLEH